MAQTDHFVQFNDVGTVDHVLTGASLSPFLGMAGNIRGPPHRDQSHGADRNQPDGERRRWVVPCDQGGRVRRWRFGFAGRTVAWVEEGSEIVGYNLATGAHCLLPGSCFPVRAERGCIATGGARGDYAAPDNPQRHCVTGPFGCRGPACVRRRRSAADHN